jgi:hypothetical protein
MTRASCEHFRSLPLLLGGLLGLFSVAAAGAAEPSAQPESAAPVATRASGAAPGSLADPNLDRGFLVSTAMTQPRGTLTYSNYELRLHRLTYGFTDRVQATLTVVPWSGWLMFYPLQTPTWDRLRADMIGPNYSGK